MPDLPFAADWPMRPDQFTYVETHAWWLGTLGPHQYLAEHRLRQWVPAREDRDWVLDRWVTGTRRWLIGSAEDATAEGYDLEPVTSVGRAQAPCGLFDGASDDGVTPTAPTLGGSWRAPTRRFLSRLPRDPEALLRQLREDNPGSWFGPFAAGVTALRTCLVPAVQRAALCIALARLPSVTAVEGIPNVDGTECLALVHDAGRTRTELLLSPVDGQFAGERDTVRVDSRSGLPAGTVVSSTAVRTAVVDEAGALPG